jgi:SET domain-containing protein
MRNHRATSWLDPRIEVRRSALGGRGMFAKAPIAAGEIVMEWGGLVVRAAELPNTAIVPDSAIPIAEDLFIVTPAGATDLDDFYLNHACDPSLWLVDAVTFAARRDLVAGDELTADYACWQDDESVVAEWRCGCGLPLCRGRVTGRDWRLPDLQERYRGHFSPFLNARIARLRSSIEQD